MYGYGFIESDWLEARPPKSVSKAIVDAKGDDAAKAMETMRRGEEEKLGKPMVWVLEGDAYVLREQS